MKKATITIIVLAMALCFALPAFGQTTAYSARPAKAPGMYASGSQLQPLWQIYQGVPQYVQMTLDHGNQISVDTYGKITSMKPHQPGEIATVQFSATIATRLRFWSRGDSISLFVVEYTPGRQVVQAYRLAGNTAEAYATHSEKTLSGTHIIQWNLDNYLMVVVGTNLDDFIDLVRDFGGTGLGTTPATFFSLVEL